MHHLIHLKNSQKNLVCPDRSPSHVLILFYDNKEDDSNNREMVK